MLELRVLLTKKVLLILVLIVNVEVKKGLMLRDAVEERNLEMSERYSFKTDNGMLGEILAF